MPWRRTDAVKERTKFVLEWERLFEKNRGMVNLSELCRAYGISRPTGYTWLDRYRKAGGDVRVWRTAHGGGVPLTMLGPTERRRPPGRVVPTVAT